jgi:LytS/YehU family sensor histidine kinase
MIIQPLVENAIKHGLYNVTDQVEIKIKCHSNDGQLLIQITNPFDTEEKSKPKKGTGFGLSSIQRRLYLLYGRNDLLETQIQDNIFISTLKIPQYD